MPRSTSRCARTRCGSRSPRPPARSTAGWPMTRRRGRRRSRRARGAPPPGAGGCPCSLWDETAVPDVASADDTSAVELGVRFVAEADGVVKGIRFYKGIANTGTHTGRLWDAQGRPLAGVTFTDETTTGWQTALFATPVAVTAGATYTASYSAPNGGYAYSRDYFARSWQNGPL